MRQAQQILPLWDCMRDRIVAAHEGAGLSVQARGKVLIAAWKAIMTLFFQEHIVRMVREDIAALLASFEESAPLPSRRRSRRTAEATRTKSPRRSGVDACEGMGQLENHAGLGGGKEGTRVAAAPGLDAVHQLNSEGLGIEGGCRSTC